MTQQHTILGALSLCLACSEPTTSDPLPGSITVSSSADSVFRVSSAAPVELTAVITDKSGNAFDGDSVVWSVSTDAVKLTGTGRRTARVAWDTTTLFGASLTQFTVSASLGGVVKTKQLTLCPALNLIIRASSRMLTGRSEPVSGSAAGVGFGLIPDLGASIGWTSSDSSVLGIQNGALVAGAPGSALLTGAACGVSDTLTVTVLAGPMYSVATVRPPGAQSSTGVDLDGAGKVVGTTSLSGAYKNFRWDGVSFADLGDCVPSRMGAHDRVLCNGTGPKVFEPGVATERDTLTASWFAIDSAGVVTGKWKGELYEWRGPGDYVKLGFAPSLFGPSLVAFTDRSARGDIVGAGLSLYGSPLFWRDGVARSLGVGGRGGWAYSVNDSGDVVGYSEVAPGSGLMAALWPAKDTWVRKALRGGGGSAFNSTATSALDINNRGEIIGSGTRGAYVWAAGRLTVLNLVLPPEWTIASVVRINDAGQVLASGSNSSTGYTGAVLLTPTP